MHGDCHTEEGVDKLRIYSFKEGVKTKVKTLHGTNWEDFTLNDVEALEF